jgi:lipopolysaccharide export system protein LptC
MDKPRLSGFRSDGRPYTLHARTAVQDARTPNTLELSDLDAEVTMSDKSLAHVVSSFAIYDSSKETMILKHDVHITSDSGYDIKMKSASVAFKGSTVETEEPLTVVMTTGTVSSDRMHMKDNGKEIIFEGHVHSVMLPAKEAASTVASLKGSGQ